MQKTLSIVVPICNERDTWREVLARLDAVNLGEVRRQIILVDDGSADGSTEQLRALEADRPDVTIKFHPRNLGKGAALRTGFAAATGDFVVVQDADMEYDPADLPALLEPLLAGDADVVYGGRFTTGRAGARMSNYLANRFLTWLSNRTTGLALADMETCYKMFRREVLERIHLEQDRFGFEPEVTAKVAALGVRVRQRPISYSPRTARQGKKIGLADGIEAIRCIFRYRPSRLRRQPRR